MPFKRSLITAVLAVLVLAQVVLVFFPAPENPEKGGGEAIRIAHQCGCPKEKILAHKCCCSGKGRTCCLPPLKAGGRGGHGSRNSRFRMPSRVENLDRLEPPAAGYAYVAACGWKERLKEQVFKKITYTPAYFFMSRPMGSTLLITAPGKQLSEPLLRPPVPPPETGFLL
ncbi:MAG: hypothetical protein ACLGPL_08185 [Acidobacteriota bacterium]